MTTPDHDEATGEERYVSACIDMDKLYDEHLWNSAVARKPEHVANLIEIAQNRLRMAEAEADRCRHRILYFESVRVEQARRIAEGIPLGIEP